MTTAKPKRPSIISTISAAMGVTSNDSMADEPAAVAAEREWPSTRAERAALHNTLLGEAQRAYTAKCDEFIARDQALHRERVVAERVYMDHCAQLKGECEAIDEREHAAARARAHERFIELARQWASEPARATSSAIARAVVQHGEDLHATRPARTVAEHVSVVLGAAMSVALEARHTDEHTSLAHGVAIAAIRGEDIVTLSDRLDALERGVRASLRTARETADNVRLSMATQRV